MAGQKCQISEGTAKLALTMYGSYFILFARFFVNSYFRSSGKSRGQIRDATCRDEAVIASMSKTNGKAVKAD